jgi:alanyl-tRNA synthetase
MTDRIYYTEPSCRSFEATVTRLIEHDGRPAVMLNRTAFYPTSGGQPFDTGRLGSVQVIETIDGGDEVVHVVSEPVSAGVAVRGEIDWTRRFDHMQQHTGQHVLSAAFDRLLENRTTSFHMGTETSTIDLAREVSAAEIERAVDEANRVVWEDREVSVRFVSADEAARLPLRKEPVRGGTLRLIEISGFDLSACGGTHVSRTGAIGMIAVTNGERFRGGARLTFVCGGRALRAFRTDRDAVAGAVRVLSVLPHELPGAIERMQLEAKESRKTVGRLQGTLAGHEAARLLSEAPVHNGIRLVTQVLDGWDATGLKGIATSLVAQTDVAAVLISSGDPLAIVVARSQNVALDANKILKAMLDRFGGRGGGRPDLAQGAGMVGRGDEIFAAARTLLGSGLNPGSA